jgi:F0F1-type ATP synthase assembly protein I
MKLLPKQTRVQTDDALGMAMEIAIMMALFIGGGFALDQWLGTLPLFMIVGTVLGAVGLFTKHKYRYDAKMDALEAERRDAIAARASTPSSTPSNTPPSTPIGDQRG